MLEAEEKRRLAAAVLRRAELQAEADAQAKAREENELGESTAAAVMLQGLFGSAILASIARKEEEILAADEVVEEIRLEFIEKARDVKVLSTLKNTKLGEYHTESEREEAQAIDETTTQRWRPPKE